MLTNDNFYPNDYKIPKTPSRYLKFEQGDNRIRILDAPITGWLDWDNKKPIRTTERNNAIDPAKPAKHFQAFPVWDYATHEVKIMELTQSTIQEYIFNLHSTEGWGKPTLYDINVIRTGENLETKYNVIAIPPQPVHADILKAWEEVKNAGFDLNRLYENLDPYGSETPQTPTTGQNTAPESASDTQVEQNIDEIFNEPQV